MEWLYPLAGFVVGAVVGLTGMGGGSLMTPLLILLFGVHPLTAVGTDLLYAAVTKTAGTAIHSRRGNVDWGVAALLSAGSIPATVLTIWVLSLMPRENPGTADIISISTGAALVIAAVAIFFRRGIRNYALAPPSPSLFRPPTAALLGHDRGGQSAAEPTSAMWAVQTSIRLHLSRPRNRWRAARLFDRRTGRALLRSR